MDLNQATQMITWLDEERRKDKAELVRLRQQVSTQAELLTEQSRRIQDLEGRLAAVQTQLTRIERFEESLRKLKEEIVLLIEKYEERRQQAERDAERLRQVERDSQSRVIAEIRKELQALARLPEELELRKAEEQRLGGVVLTLQQQVADLEQDVENRTRNIPYFEEQRQRDAQRIARLEQENTELLRRIEAQVSKLQLLEESLLRNEQRLNELSLEASRLQEEQRDFIEDMQVAEQGRRRQMDEWKALMEEQQQRMEEYAQRMRFYAEQYQRMKQTLENLEQLGQRLQQRQNEVAELQRLAEERMKARFEEWEANIEKRWRKETLIWEQQWREQGQWNEVCEGRLDALEENTESLQGSLKALIHSTGEALRRQMSACRDSLIDLEELAGTTRG